MSGGIRVKKIKNLMIASLIGLFALSTVGCNMIAKTAASINNSPVATVNSDTITKEQLDVRMLPVLAQMKSQGLDPSSAQGKQTVTQQKSEMLDTMIMESIIVEKAKENNIMPTEAKLTAAVNNKLVLIKQSFPNSTGVPDAASFQQALVQAGFTEASLKDYLRMEEIKQVVSDFITRNIKVTDAQVKEQYDNNLTQYAEKPDTIHVAHILLKTKAEALAVVARLDKNGDFATIAKSVSIDTASKAKGGDLGVVPYVGSTMDPIFMKAAIALKVGAISGPVQTQFGFHIIKCIAKNEYPIKTFDAVKVQIKNALLTTEKNTLLNDTLNNWRSSSKIETAKYTKNL